MTALPATNFYLLCSPKITMSIKLIPTIIATVALATTPLCAQRITRSFTEPIERSVVASTETGVIHAATVREGDRVCAGDQLAVLNHDVLIQSRRIAAARAESTATRDAARSRAEMVKSQKEKMDALIEGGHVNAYEVEQKTSEYQNAIAELQTAEDELRLNRLEVDRIEAQIRQRIITSPIDGIVTLIHKQLGEQVSTNEPQYATIVRVDQLKVRFYLNAETLFKIPVGSNVDVLVGEQRTRTPAKVTFASPIIDPDSGTGRLEVVIENQDQKIASGTICFWDERSNDHRRVAEQNRLPRK